MTNIKITRNYTCTQSELYAALIIAWHSYEANLSLFSIEKGYYNAAYGTAALEEITAAQAMPDKQARGEVPESLHLLMMTAKKTCLAKWSRVESYIIRAFPDLIKSKTEAAGADYFRSASNNNWEDLTSLMVAGHNFLVTNETDLMAGNNMPATFITGYVSSMENFAAMYANFITAEEDTRTQSQDKLIANNAIHFKTQAMLDDGQIYCVDNPALLEQFIFASILRLVSSPGAAGLKGVILNGNTSGLLANVSLSLYSTPNLALDADYITASDEDGKYNFGGIASGTYTLKMEHEGFVTKLETVVISLGVTSSKNFTLVGA